MMFLSPAEAGTKPHWLRTGLLVAALTSAGAAQGEELVAREHGFAVTLPATAQGGAARPDGSTAWKALAGGVDYAVLIVPLKEPRPPDDVLNGFAGNFPATLKVSNDRYLARGGRAGRELLAEDGAGHFMHLLAFSDNVDERAYIVLAEGQRSPRSHAAVRAVFESFRFMEPRREETYAAPDGSFSLRFPGPVRATKSDGGAKHEAEHNGFVYELRVLTLPAAPDPERHLDRVRESRVGEGLRLVRETRTTVAGFPARDIDTEDKEGVAVWTARAIADSPSRRLYLLSVLAPKARALAHSPDAAAFFDTLRIGRSAGPPAR
jgi:hypothetical protein